IKKSTKEKIWRESKPATRLNDQDNNISLGTIQNWTVLIDENIWMAFGTDLLKHITHR
ncbi:hypothetical protein CU098_003937, partial [Rhizopus stolonifer]